MFEFLHHAAGVGRNLPPHRRDVGSLLPFLRGCKHRLLPVRHPGAGLAAPQTAGLLGRMQETRWPRLWHRLGFVAARSAVSELFEEKG